LISLINSSLSLKSVSLISSNISEIEDIKPFSFPIINIPIVPVYFMPKCLASRLPFKSSIIKSGSFFSSASAIALASP
jgi:hypothetical protein